MTEALALGEKLLSLLAQSVRASTYKPALLLAIVDRSQEYLNEERIPVRALAERVIELYWPQTLAYPTTGEVLRQSQTRGQAAIVSALLGFRKQQGARSRVLPETLRRSETWSGLVDRVEETLAEWPIPRLQRPFTPFLYSFDWRWQEAGGWSSLAYWRGDRTISLFPGVGAALTELGPLLRPFITRWWTDKAAQLNPDVEAARSTIEFEDLLFGRDRVVLERIAEGLLDLQRGDCFYCGVRIGRRREIDHFVPWTYSGDDGLDNLVAACHRCNNEKRASLPGPAHVADLLRRNQVFNQDLDYLSAERTWPRDHQRSMRIARAAYLRSPDERPLWLPTRSGEHFESLGPHRRELGALLH